jgi:hypothetical protein
MISRRKKGVLLLIITFGIIFAVLYSIFFIWLSNLITVFSYEILTILIGLTTFLTGIIIGVYTIRVNKKIAEQSGLLDKPDLDIILFDKSLIKKDEFNQIIYANPYEDKSAGKKNYIFCSLPFVIKNNNEKVSAKNVVLDIKIPKGCRGDGLAGEFYKYTQYGGHFDKEELKRKNYNFDGYDGISYVIPEIIPEGKAYIEELVEISYLSGIPIDVDRIVKDNKSYNVKVEALIASDIYIGVSATDIKKKEKRLKIRAYRAKNKEEFAEKIFEEETRILRDELRNKNYPEDFISNMYSSKVKEKSIAIQSMFNKINYLKDVKELNVNVYLFDKKKFKIAYLIPEKNKKKNLNFYKDDESE